jgi:selenide,water dikinase
MQAILTDPQTSGGLLVACDEQAVAEVQGIFLRRGFTHASVIGRIIAGRPEVYVD